MKRKRIPSSNITVTWFGHSAFHVRTSGGISIFLDPWLDNPKAPAGALESAAADLILITHGHADHVGNSIELARRTGAHVVAIHEVSLFLKSRGVGDVTGMNKGGTHSFRGIEITMVDARHSSGIDIGENIIPGGEAAGYILAFPDGPSLYHAGDTSLFGDMRLIRELYAPSVVLLPIGGLYTMAPREASVACAMLKPKYIVGMHYGTFPALSGTPEELRKHLPAPLKRRVVELEIGVPRLFN